MNAFPLTPKLPLVKQVAARIAEEPFFSDHPPDVAQICSALNTAFWASMQSEEGRSVRASLILMKPGYLRSEETFRFSDPIHLSSHIIAKLSASFPFGRGAVGVTFSSAGRPLVWGFVLPKPEHGWVLEILGPGYIVIRNGLSIQAAVLPDGSLILFDELTHLEDDWCNLLFHHANHTSVGRPIPFERRAHFHGLLRVLSRAMVDHRRGGSVVIVNPGDDAWKNAVDFTYALGGSQEYLTVLYSKLGKWQVRWSRNQDRKRKAKGEERPDIAFYPDSAPERRLLEALRLVGGLTAVDGALVMTNRLEILGYGAKLKATEKELSVKEWLPFRGYARESMRLEDLGGTRHRSAALFAAQHPETSVFVASQDGRFTIFCADGAGTEVLALRVELLLL